MTREICPTCKKERDISPCFCSNYFHVEPLGIPCYWPVDEEKEVDK